LFESLLLFKWGEATPPTEIDLPCSWKVAAMVVVSRADRKSVKRESSRPPRGLWKEIVKARWPYLFIAPFYISFLIFGL
jgi:hypothetical protein